MVPEDSNGNWQQTQPFPITLAKSNHMAKPGIGKVGKYNPPKTGTVSLMTIGRDVYFSYRTRNSNPEQQCNLLLANSFPPPSSLVEMKSVYGCAMQVRHRPPPLSKQQLQIFHSLMLGPKDLGSDFPSPSSKLPVQFQFIGFYSPLLPRPNVQKNSLFLSRSFFAVCTKTTQSLSALLAKHERKQSCDKMATSGKPMGFSVPRGPIT